MFSLSQSSEALPLSLLQLNLQSGSVCKVLMLDCIMHILYLSV